MENNRFSRRSSRTVKVGHVTVGGSSPVSVQSMTNTDPHDARATSDQIKRLSAAGCDIVRLAIPDMEAAETFGLIREECPSVPLVADIHFDYRLALAVAERGVDKIRINPGNIGSDENVRAVAKACRERNIPIRIGVNSGSAEKSLIEKYGGPTAEALAESAMYHARLLERYDFGDIIIAVKASDVPTTVAAVRQVACLCDYPLHVGVTEAGSEYGGIIKSAAGIGTLLMEGIGDTIRVSLTAEPEKEVTAGITLLKALGLRKGPNIVSCPSCGRTKIDLFSIVSEFERRAPVEIEGWNDLGITVAVMGCIVNGPGEASNADIGLAGGSGRAAVFKGGKVIFSVDEDKAVDALIYEIKKL